MKDIKHDFFFNMPNVQRMYKAPFLKNKKCDELLNLLELKEGCKRLKKKEGMYLHICANGFLSSDNNAFIYLLIFLFE